VNQEDISAMYGAIYKTGAYLKADIMSSKFSFKTNRKVYE